MTAEKIGEAPAYVFYGFCVIFVHCFGIAALKTLIKTQYVEPSHLLKCCSEAFDEKDANSDCKHTTTKEIMVYFSECG